jgi:diguanylate cyclase (GGDEF)-like protein
VSDNPQPPADRPDRIDDAFAHVIRARDTLTSEQREHLALETAQIMLAYNAFELGVEYLQRDQPAAAARWLAMAADQGIDEARQLFALASASGHHDAANSEPLEPENDPAAQQAHQIIADAHAEATLILEHARAQAAELLTVGSRNSIAATDTQVTEDMPNTVAATIAVHQALHDSLTGLPNRTLLLDRLCQVLARTTRHPTRTAVVIINLDDFKNINNSLGHDTGDQLLHKVAQRILQHVRPEDTVARLSGDQFVVLCPDLVAAESRAEQKIAELSERLRMALATPATIDGFKVEVTASIGIALSDGTSVTPEDMLRNADAAMYSAKTQGKNRWEIYDKTQRARAVDRVAIATTLRQALRDNRFVLHFQPIVELDTGMPVAVESLVRLHDPDRGLLPPSTFIQVAEDSGLIVPIGTYVLEQTCHQLAEWRAQGLASPDLRATVNLSARQAAQPDLAQTVTRALSQANLAPTALTLELPETVLMEADTSTVRQLEQLQEMGVGLGIDDFGTGYSSLSYLKRLPVTSLKVDRSFVAGLATDPADREIVTAIIRLGHALGLTTIAEGVEVIEQFELLRELGCDQAQGYLLGRPAAGPPTQPQPGTPSAPADHRTSASQPAATDSRS